MKFPIPPVISDVTVKLMAMILDELRDSLGECLWKTIAMGVTTDRIIVSTKNDSFFTFSFMIRTASYSPHEINVLRW